MENHQRQPDGKGLSFHNYERNWYILVGKLIDRIYRTNDFEPVGEWKVADDYLQLGGEFHFMVFSDLIAVQVDSQLADASFHSATRQKIDTQ